MKAFLLIVVLLCGCAAAPITPTPYASTAQSVVLLDTVLGHGSAVVINEHCLLTANHVVDDDTPVDTSLKVVAADKKVDLAVLCGTATYTHIAILGPTPAKFDYIYIMGYPLYHGLTMTEGRFMYDTLITAPAAPGNSGGGAFDSKGRLIGIVDGIDVMKNQHWVFPYLDTIVPLSDIEKFLTTNHITYGKYHDQQ